MKLINILITSIALLLIGYYIGYNRSVSNTNLKNVSEKSPHILVSNEKKDKTKEILLKETITKSQNIKFKVKVISASMEKEHIDENLKEIKNMFNSVAQFSEFRLLKEDSFDVKIGESKKITLPNNKIIYFTPRNIDDNNSLALNIRIPWVLNINLHTESNEGFFQGGLKNGDDFIILYIEPSF
jgi:hypothetical protein